MRFLSLFLVFFALVGTALAWDKEDHEIFDIVSALEQAEGKGTTFYSFLNIPSTASVKEIGKAFKTLSVTMHPDKNPNVKGIAERFARLGTIWGILKKPEGRKRYDFFYKNGVPKWKGTGYFYSRYRPGFITVSLFLALLTSLFQHLYLTLNYRRDLQRITDLIARAQTLAWTTPASSSSSRVGGAQGAVARLPVAVKDAKKKVLVPLTAGTGAGGRTVECMVWREGEVYLIEPTSPPSQTLLTPDLVSKPSFTTSTWPFLLLQSLQQKVAGSKIPESPVEEGESSEEQEAVVVKEAGKEKSKKESGNGKAVKRR
ncbi:hypothetical protein BDY24DRAFT_362673 [Mrakia frigida]|uniref:Erj5p n=1 Tax=Mrakia frigida TaxID=29902 RepID=UPI003FCC06C7